VLGGKLIDFAGHCKRLARSLAELDMAAPVTDDELLAIHRELVAVNGMTDGMVYLQITRGAPGDRDFAFPDPATTPSTLVLFTQSKPGLAENPAAKTGMKVISIPDIRWGRRDIKTVQLLYPSMGKMMAKKAGCDDAWMVEDGFVTAICRRKSCRASPAPPSCALPPRHRWKWKNAPSPSTRQKRRMRPFSPRPRPL
jgi:D-alanine transaminase